MKGFTLWFTGLSGSGKSTLSQAIEPVLLERDIKVEILDGDEIRTNLSKGLGFSKQDRDTNVRRIGFVASMLSRNDVVAITAAISPYKEIRDEIRARTETFVEIYTECSIEELTRRDPKGLYKRALAGELANFTGISDPYEPPENADIVVNTERETLEESLDKIVRSLELMGLIPAGEDQHTSPEEEVVIRERLQALGYL
jgi:adenylyl-sulfate kinase